MLGRCVVGRVVAVCSVLAISGCATWDSPAAPIEPRFSDGVSPSAPGDVQGPDDELRALVQGMLRFAPPDQVGAFLSGGESAASGAPQALRVADGELQPVPSESDDGTAVLAETVTEAATESATEAATEAVGDLWERIRSGFAMPDLKSALVEQNRRRYLAHPESLQRMFERGNRYLHFIVEELERRGLPMELALLPFVESAMNPVALSHARASGLWQFIPETGRRYELSQDWWVDERRDVVRSTRAALDYLQAIHAMHGNDWFLALASYNWGENAVARAVRQNRARGLPGTYLHLQMPRETRHYVPKLIALRQIVAQPNRYGVTLPELPDRPYFTSITKTRPIDLALAARFAGMPVEEFLSLNPSHNRPVIAATRDKQIRLPTDRVDAFMQAMARHVEDGESLVSWQPYELKAGETLAQVARRSGIDAAGLMQANGLSPGAEILPGSVLLVPSVEVPDEARLRSFDGPRIRERVRTPARYHVVRQGETLASIARRHGITVAVLSGLNGERSGVQPGQRLLVRAASTRTVERSLAGGTGGSSSRAIRGGAMR